MIARMLRATSRGAQLITTAVTVAGSYSHTFDAPTTVHLIGIVGAGGAGWYYNGSTGATNGNDTVLQLNGVTIATGGGGHAPPGYGGGPGTNGVGTNTITGATNNNVGGGIPGYWPSGAGGASQGNSNNGGTGGSVYGGTFAVNVGDVLTCTYGASGIGTPVTLANGYDGAMVIAF